MKRWFHTKYLEKTVKADEAFLKVPDFDPVFLKRIKLPDIKKMGALGDDFFDDDNSPQITDFEKNARSIFFSKIQINRHSPDIRSLWESGRLQRVSKILFSDPNSFKEVLNSQKKIVISWINDNPFLHGVHYMSPMECGLRIPVFLYLLKIEKIDWHPGEVKTILSTLYSQVWWISRNLALYSSLGNHTICECVGLIFGGAVFQDTKEGKKWLKTGCRLLEQEISHQILNDGGPAEQSLNYHRFVLDLYWLAVDFLESNNFYDCTKWKGSLRKSESFLNAFLFEGSRFPSIGDSDDGYAIAPGLYPNRQIKDLNKTFPQTGLSYRTFQESGYTVIGSTEGFLMTFDHGPLGLAPLYNHGHADALSITLYKNENPFLIDPGTYLYNGVPKHRKYFRGTRAHNTVCIDGQDQAKQLTGFIWGSQYQANLGFSNQYPDRFYFKAKHDGYKRLKDFVVHHRELIVHKDICCLIYDSFTGKGSHEFELNFHLDPGVKIEQGPEWLVLNNSGESIFLYNSDNCFSITNGQKNPLLGWYSPAYGVLQKTNTLQSAVTGFPANVGFVTLICLNEIYLNKAIQIREEFMEKKCEDIPY